MKLQRFTLLLALLCTPFGVMADSEGPNSPSTITSDISNGGNDPWVNPGNAAANDGSETEADLGDGDASYYLNAQSFDFSIPDGSTIDGIVVEIEAALGASSSCRSEAEDTAVYLLKGGSVVGDNKATNSEPNSTADTYESYGGAADLWGTTWSPSEINASNFGAVFEYTETSGEDDCEVEVDHIRITVHYTAAVEADPVPDLSQWAMAALLGLGGYFMYRENVFSFES